MRNPPITAPRDGFTLVELLIYIAISAVILMTVASFFGFLLYAQSNDRAVADVQEQGTAAMEIMTQTLRNASSVTGLAPGATSSSISIIDASVPSTVFTIANGILQITEASNTPVALTSPRLYASALSFYNATASGTRGIIRIQFTLGHIKSGDTSTVDYSQTFIDSAALWP